METRSENGDAAKGKISQNYRAATALDNGQRSTRTQLAAIVTCFSLNICAACGNAFLRDWKVAH